MMSNIEETLHRFWTNGNGLRETVRAIKRRHGVSVTTEQVRQRFVDYAGERK